MKQAKILLLAVVALLLLMSVSCTGAAQPTGGWSGPTVHDGVVYVGTRDGRVVAINASSRQQQWEWPDTTGLRGLIYTTPIVDGDLVYVGTYSGKVVALNATARSQDLSFPQKRYGEWEWDCPTENARSNAVVADLVASEDSICVSSSNGRVYSLDKKSGDLNWKSEVLDKKHGKLWTSPVIQGNTLYVSTFGGYIYDVSLETGELLGWSFKAEAGFASSPVINEDTIFVGSFDRHLYALRIGSNVSMWKFPQEKPAGNWFWASPIVNEGIVYAGCLDGKVYAIEAETGEKLWEFDAESPIVSSPVLMDNLLTVIGESGTVCVFDISAEIGDEVVPLKTISIGAGVRSSFCAQDGLVYIRDENNENNQLYVVDIEKGEVSWNFSLTK